MFQCIVCERASVILLFSFAEGLGFTGSYDIGPTIRGAQDANGRQQVSDDAPSNPIRLGSRRCRGFLPGTHSLGT